MSQRWASTTARRWCGGNIDNVKFHHKLHLVPFGEYLPGRSWVPGLEAVLGGIPAGGPRSGHVHGATAAGEASGAGDPADLLEDTVGRVARRFAREAPQVMINMTNDGWFIRSVENQVHLNNALFRCIELRRPMCRAANTGVTAVIDDRGVVVDELRDPQDGQPVPPRGAAGQGGAARQDGADGVCALWRLVRCAGAGAVCGGVAVAEGIPNCEMK